MAVETSLSPTGAMVVVEVVTTGATGATGAGAGAGTGSTAMMLSGISLSVCIGVCWQLALAGQSQILELGILDGAQRSIQIT